MTNGGKNVYITRGEFYPTMIVVWLFIMSITNDLLQRGWRWTIGLLWVASLFMVVIYSVQTVKTLRSIRAQKKSGKSL